MQQFSAVIMDVASTVGAYEYGEAIKCATYSNAIIQVYSPDTGSAQLQVNSVDDPNIAGTPDDNAWYNVSQGFAVSAGWEAGFLTPICAKYLRVFWFGAIGDEVKAVVTLQG